MREDYGIDKHGCPVRSDSLGAGQFSQVCRIGAKTSSMLGVLNNSALNSTHSWGPFTIIHQVLECRHTPVGHCHWLWISSPRAIGLPLCAYPIVRPSFPGFVERSSKENKGSGPLLKHTTEMVIGPTHIWRLHWDRFSHSGVLVSCV